MVKGTAKFQSKMRAIPKLVVREVQPALRKTAEDVTKEMELFNPLRGTIDIDWRDGPGPKGTMKSDAGKGAIMSVSVFANAYVSSLPGKRGVSGWFPAVARWFEFGTGPRAQETTGRFTGRIPAQPYFFPVIRANRRRIRSRVRAAVRRAFKAAE